MDLVIFLSLGALAVIVVIWARYRFWSFSAQEPQDYADDPQTIDIREHLRGETQCDGVIYGPTGRVSSRFAARFSGAWNGDEGTIKEHFTYDDGTTQDREWHLKVGEGGRIRATAPDVLGEGGGWQQGPAVQLRYRIRLPESSGGHVLDTVDWMYLTPNGTIMNRSQFRKFGIKVAELVATIRPRAAS